MLGQVLLLISAFVHDNLHVLVLSFHLFFVVKIFFLLRGGDKLFILTTLFVLINDIGVYWLLLLLLDGLSVFDLLFLRLANITNYLIFDNKLIFFFRLLFFSHELFSGLVTLNNFVAVCVFLLVLRLFNLVFLDFFVLDIAFDLIVIWAFYDLSFFIDIYTNFAIALNLILNILFISAFVFAGNDIILFLDRLLLFFITHDVVLHGFVVFLHVGLREFIVNYLLGLLTFFLIVLLFFDLLFGFFILHALSFLFFRKLL